MNEEIGKEGEEDCKGLGWEGREEEGWLGKEEERMEDEEEEEKSIWKERTEEEIDRRGEGGKRRGLEGNGDEEREKESIV